MALCDPDPELERVAIEVANTKKGTLAVFLMVLVEGKGEKPVEVPAAIILHPGVMMSSSYRLLAEALVLNTKDFHDEADRLEKEGR